MCKNKVSCPITQHNDSGETRTKDLSIQSQTLHHWVTALLFGLFKNGNVWKYFMYFLSCVCYVLVRVCLFVPCGHLLGKSRPLGSRLWCLTVSLSLSHWYPGSGVVLDCILIVLYYWSLHPYFFNIHVYLWSMNERNAKYRTISWQRSLKISN